MDQQTRREFLKTGSVAMTAAVTGVLVSSCGSDKKPVTEKWPGFRYAMCNESMKDLPWEQQCAIVADAGYKGIEIAPFTLVKTGIREISAIGRQAMRTSMSDAGLECVGLHWLLALPPKGLHFTTPNEKVRKKSVAYLIELIDFCGDLGGTVMVFGSPKQRNTQGISVSEAKNYFADGLAAVADHAQQRGVQILIEPLDTSQTDVVNTLAEAKEIIDHIQHPAIQTMFDFHNTPNETEPFDVLIAKYFEHIKHVHVQEIDGRYLGTGDAVTTYVKGFQKLKDLKYDKWISLEVFDFSPGGKTIAEESMKTLKQIEAKLS